jgi:hypothetical protein
MKIIWDLPRHHEIVHDLLPSDLPVAIQVAAKRGGLNRWMQHSLEFTRRSFEAQSFS